LAHSPQLSSGGAREGPLKMVKLGSFPVDTHPRVKNRVGWFEARAIGLTKLSVMFDPVEFLSNP